MLQAIPLSQPASGKYQTSFNPWDLRLQMSFLDLVLSLTSLSRTASNFIGLAPDNLLTWSLVPRPPVTFPAQCSNCPSPPLLLNLSTCVCPVSNGIIVKSQCLPGPSGHHRPKIFIDMCRLSHSCTRQIQLLAPEGGGAFVCKELNS